MNKISVVLSTLLLLSNLNPLYAADAPSADKKIKIVLIGDSTMTDSAGWGLGFRQFVNDRAEVLNESRGGRSSLSFMTEGRWTNALALKGDYYLIQFGHNNEPGKPGRSTDMPTFIANMRQYVTDAKAIGAKPILLTPLVRRQWDKADPGHIKSSLAPYAVEVRKIAAEENVPLVELHDLSKALCESLGREKCYEFSPLKQVAGTNILDGTAVFDGTHLKPNGSVMMARLIVDELRAKVPELAPVFRAEPLSTNPVATDSKYNAVVAFDGSGNFTNLQDAINSAPDNGTNWFSILIKPGTYDGEVVVPKAKRHIRLIGEERDNTILNSDRNQLETPFGRVYPNNPTLGVAADDFRMESLTLQNTSGDHGQALALRSDGDREILNNCRLLGWQDTLLVNSGRLYFTNCYIAGRVDFIYGNATAIFDRCEIHSRNGGHVTAANTPKDHPYGFVFLRCKLTGDPQPWINPSGIPVNTNQPPKADLGRPWRPYASVAYIQCDLGDHIKPEGWNNWRNVTNESTARFSEYQSTGPGANPDQRFKWSHQLTDEQAKNYTIENILSRSDNWKPDSDPDRL